MRCQSSRPLARRSSVGVAARVGPRAPTARPQPARRRATPAAPVGRGGAGVVTPAPTRRSRSCASKPGITIPEIAESLKIEPNYLYRVMPKLVEDGQVTREGQGWHPAAAK